MDREQILERINAIKEELANDQFVIIKDKILERKFHHHKSNRKFLMRRLIEGMRRRLMMEIELLLEPMLDNQKEINLRLLEEVKRLKRDVDALKQEKDKDENVSKNKKPWPEDLD